MKQIDRNVLDSSDLLFNKGRLASGYLFGLGVIAALAVAAFVTLVLEINSQRRFATVINEAGYQRALSQRIALFALRASQPAATPAELRSWRETLRADLERMERVHRGMLRGDKALNFPAPPLPEVVALYRQGPLNLERPMQRFFDSVHTLLAKPEGVPFDAGGPELASILQVVPGELLGGLDRGVTLYEQASQRRLVLLRTLAIGALLVVFIVMAGEALLIFRPLILEIIREGQALEEARRRLDAVINTVAEAIITADEDNRIVSANAEAEYVWKVGPGELIGQRLSHLVLSGRELPPGEWREQFLRRRHVETIGVRRGGETFPLDLTLTEARVDGEAGGSGGSGGRIFSLTGRDTSREAEAARQLAAARDAALDSARAKSEFVASMSHEIRTPLNGILGMTDLLLGTGLAPRQREYVDTIRQSSDALLTIINDILDFSKSEAGKMTLETIDFDLRGLIEGVGDLLAGRAVQKQLELILFVEPDVPTNLRGDPGRLRQVLLNLVGNALKFTKTGEVVVRISVEMDAPGRAELRFLVQDTGIGIDPAAQSRLFQAFSQAEESTARRFGGTGLGLTISQQLVELMGGHIELESAPGRGSTFWFTVQFDKQPPAMAGEENEAETAERRRQYERRKRLSGVRVLVVDDNKTLRELFARRLAAWGMIADCVGDGPSALNQLRQRAVAGEPYDIAVLDLNLGSMDGYTLAWAIHSQPALSATRLVLMTALGLEADGRSYRQVGINASITKPLKRDKVLDTLVRVVSGEDLSAAPDPVAAARAASTAAALLAAAETVEDSPPGKPFVVLVVDDNPTNRKLAVRQLENLGYDAESAEDGVKALARLDQRYFDAVLLDMQMPELDGCQTAVKIREREKASPSGRRLPLIAMTASTAVSDREACLAAGMDDYLSKPVRQDDLGRLLMRWLEASG